MAENDVLAALVAGLLGLSGGMITIPINMIVSLRLKRDEILYQHKLDEIAKKRELLLQHKLEIAKLGDICKIEKLEKRVELLEKVTHEH